MGFDKFKFGVNASIETRLRLYAPAGCMSRPVVKFILRSGALGRSGEA